MLSEIDLAYLVAQIGDMDASGPILMKVNRGVMHEVLAELRALRASQAAVIEAAFRAGIASALDYDDQTTAEAWERYRAQLEKGGA